MVKKTDSTKQFSCCSFCGRPEADVEKLIAGPHVYICDRCIVLCAGLLDKKPTSDSDESKTSSALDIPPLKPKDIKAKIQNCTLTRSHNMIWMEDNMETLFNQDNLWKNKVSS